MTKEEMELAIEEEVEKRITRFVATHGTPREQVILAMCEKYKIERDDLRIKMKRILEK